VAVDRLEFCYRTSKALDGDYSSDPRKKSRGIIVPTGCGKSTLLRCFNRMNDLIDYARVAAGEIRIDGANIYAPEVDVTELRKPRENETEDYVSGRFG
jgi:phosphate transport system ATP-binding protein